MRFKGHLDRVTSNRISGWAVDTTTSIAVSVEIQINGHKYITVQANQPRADVAAKHLHPTGYCGFSIELPPTKGLQLSDVVSARIVGAERDLSGSPMVCKYGANHTTRTPSSAEDRPDMASGAFFQSNLREARVQIKSVNLPAAPIFPIPLARSSSTIFIHSFIALFLRTVKVRFGTQRFGYFLAIAEPLFYIILMRGSRFLAGKGGSFLNEEGGVDGFFYHAIGVITFFLFMRVFSSCLGTINANNPIFTYRQLKPIDSILVSAVIESILMIFLFFGISLALFGLEHKVEFDDLLSFINAALLLIFLGVGLGLLADVYTSKSPALRKFVEIVNRPLLFISGAFFTMDDIPTFIKPYIVWNPILHGVDLCRGALLSAYDSPGDWVYLLTWVLASLWFGLAAYRRNLYRLTQA